MFNDLKKAILDLLKSAKKHNHEWEEALTTCIVDKKLLYILQQEYNIFFVEPTDKQIDIIEKP